MKSKRIYTLLTVLLLSLIATVPVTAQLHELRSFWIATVWRLDWPQTAGTSVTAANQQKRQMTELLDRLAEANYNAIWFQVRSMCDAMYDSKYEPWSSNLTGTRGATPAYDPLEFIVEECHKRGMECHAWINPFRFSTGTAYDTANDNEMRNNGWLITHGSTTVMNPALPEVRQRIVDICRDILDNYDVDGIVFDDYFYPSGIPTNSSAEDYAQFAASGASDMGDWRRENVNKTVKSVYDMIQEVKPFVKFGIGPRGIAATDQAVADKYGVPRCPTGYDSQYNQIFCDPLAWLSAGTIDYISPQIYWARGYSAGDFSILCPWWYDVAEKFGRHCYVSHSLEYFKDGEQTPDTREKTFEGMAAQVQMNRDESSSAPGSCFYSYSCVDDENETEKGVDFFTYMKDNKFQNKALTPCISWKEAPEQGKVANLREKDGVLEWDAVNNMRYAVYLLPEGTSHDGRLLNVAKNLKAHLYYNRYELPEGYEKCEAAVAIVDRYGNRYSPQWISVGKPSGIEDAVNSDFAVRIEGNKVVFPAKVESVDVYDTVGKQLASYGDCSEINLEEKDGIVILRIDTGERIVTQKVSIK